MNFSKLLLAFLLLSLPAAAQAADITGVPKIREGDYVQIGNHRIRLGGVDAPATDQLCLNTKGERWTCGAAARDELTKRFGPDMDAWTYGQEAFHHALIRHPLSAVVNTAMRDTRERIPVRPGDVLILQETPDEAIVRYFTQVFSFSYVTRTINSQNTTATAAAVVP